MTYQEELMKVAKKYLCHEITMPVKMADGKYHWSKQACADLLILSNVNNRYFDKEEIEALYSPVSTSYAKEKARRLRRKGEI